MYREDVGVGHSLYAPKILGIILTLGKEKEREFIFFYFIISFKGK